MRSDSEGAANPNRRQVLKAGGLGAAAALSIAAPAGAQQPADDVITRVIPKSGERVPVLGLGTFTTFDTLPGQPRGHLEEVTRRFWRGGGRVFDVSPLYGAAEANLGDFARRLDINDRMLVTNKVWACGDYAWDDSHADQARRESMRRLGLRRPIDVMQVHSLVNVDIFVPLLHAWKQEGRIRYLGATTHDPLLFDLLASWAERGDLDFLQVHYSIHTRQAERRVIPAALANGVAVQVNMPLEKARLHRIVQGRPLPHFAREFGMRTWSEFFLKWVVAHPGVTCVVPATANPDHMTENLAAMRGPLPDEQMRQRMVSHMETIPGFAEIGSMPWYPGKAYTGLVARAQASIRQRSPWWPG